MGLFRGSLKREKYIFLTNSGAYGREEELGLFVERIESLISKENVAWGGRVACDKIFSEKKGER